MDDAAAHVATRFFSPAVNRRCAKEGTGAVVLLVVRTLVQQAGIGDPTRHSLRLRNVIRDGGDNELLGVSDQAIYRG